MFSTPLFAAGLLSLVINGIMEVLPGETEKYFYIIPFQMFVGAAVGHYLGF